MDYIDESDVVMFTVKLYTVMYLRGKQIHHLISPVRKKGLELVVLQNVGLYMTWELGLEMRKNILRKI